MKEGDGLRIAMIGAGAMGCLFASYLSTVPGNQITLIDISKPQIEAINQVGVHVEQNGTFKHFKSLRGERDSMNLDPMDMVFVFVKSPLTREAVHSNRRLFGENTIAVTLQNGLGNAELIGEEIGLSKVIAGTTAHGAYLKSPGIVVHAGLGDTFLGAMSKDGDLEGKRVAEVLNLAGIKTGISTNVKGLLWDKLLVNAGINALTGITRLKNGRLLDFPELSEIMELAIKEGEQVAKANKIKLSHKDPYAYARMVCEATAENKSSMLSDILKGNLTEIDMINGAIVREGKLAGVETPVNQTLTNLIKFFQGSGL